MDGWFTSWEGIKGEGRVGDVCMQCACVCGVCTHVYVCVCMPCACVNTGTGICACETEVGRAFWKSVGGHLQTQ